MINPQHYDSEDGVFNLPLFIYDSLRDLMKSEFDQIRSVIKDEEEADRVVRLIKNRYQTVWSQVGMAMFKVGLVEPCNCSPKQKCSKCQGAQWIMYRGIDYKELSDHADDILRTALTRRMQSPEFKQALENRDIELEEDGDDKTSEVSSIDDTIETDTEATG